MKRLLILVLLFILVGCSSSNIATTVVCPSGGPLLSLIPLIDDDNYVLDVVDGGEVLQAEFAKGEADIIVAPVNLGTKLSLKTGNYKISHIVTFSNLYFVTKDSNYTKIAAFGKESVPGKVVQYLDDYIPSDRIEWYESVNEALASLLSGQCDAAILAYPAVSKIEDTKEYNIENILNMYKEKSGYSNYPQAALFVSNSYYEDNEDTFNRTIETLMRHNVDYIVNDKQFNEFVNNHDMSQFGIKDKSLVLNRYDKLAINIKPIHECKDDVNQLLSLFGFEMDDSIILGMK